MPEAGTYVAIVLAVAGVLCAAMLAAVITWTAGAHRALTAQTRLDQAVASLRAADTKAARARRKAVAAGVDEPPQQGPRVVHGGVAAPGHGAEAEASDPETGPADGPPLHQTAVMVPCQSRAAMSRATRMR